MSHDWLTKWQMLDNWNIPTKDGYLTPVQYVKSLLVKYNCTVHSVYYVCSVSISLSYIYIGRWKVSQMLQKVLFSTVLIMMVKFTRRPFRATVLVRGPHWLKRFSFISFMKWNLDLACDGTIRMVLIILYCHPGGGGINRTKGGGDKSHY